MKRYNIHIPEKWPEQLQEIRNKILKTGKQNWFWQSLSVADLMRIAISACYGLEDPEVHIYNDEIKKAINRVCKFKPWPGKQYK